MDCKRCGAPLNQGAVLCPECGARQRRRSGAVRCASCHKTVPLGLTVCPHCGRNVRPAGPRWGWWVAGSVAIVLVSLWGLDKLPIASAVQEVQALRERVSGLVQVLGPVSSPSPVPTEVTVAQVPVALQVDTPVPTEPPPSPTPTPGPTATPTSEATDEATATPTLESTSTPTPSPTVTTAPLTATATVSGTTTYRVQAGDTLSSIAARFGISWEALAAANGLTASSVLRIGQELIVPLPGASLPPTATATPRPRPTATPAPPTPTPQLQLPAPVLANPGDQTPFSGASAFIELTWEPVDGIGPGDQYQVVVRWVEQGAPQEHYWFRTVAGSPLPAWLWGRADQPARKYTWYVRVVRVTTDGQGGELVIPLSPPSQSRVFYWN